jgi:hypothetical protein
MRCRLSQVVRRGDGLQLAHHDWDEVVEGAEEGLDARVAEGQVGEGDDGVATDLTAGGAADAQMMTGFMDRFGKREVAVDVSFNLKKREQRVEK